MTIFYTTSFISCLTSGLFDSSAIRHLFTNYLNYSEYFVGNSQLIYLFTITLAKKSGLFPEKGAFKHIS
jgi:hypothetical protein